MGTLSHRKQEEPGLSPSSSPLKGILVIGVEAILYPP